MKNSACRRLCLLASLALSATGLARSAFAQGWVVAEGGGISGSETYMADLFSFMVEKGKAAKPATPLATGQARPAPSVAIIGAVPLDKDERVEAFMKAGASAVTCLIITEVNADSQEIYDALSAVDVIFIRGGDQGRYVNWWRGKKTEAAIKAVFARGGVVSGSSAGCAIMGEWTYDAVKDGLSPRESLNDAQHENLTITHGFLGLVPNVLFDTHFTERGRLPRTVVMLARIASTRMSGWKDADTRGFTVSDVKKLQDATERLTFEHNGDKTAAIDFFSPLAIGVDPRTAVCVGPDRVALVKGEGTATLLRLSKDTRIVSKAGQPPSVSHVLCSQLLPGTTFDTRSGEVLSRPADVAHLASVHAPLAKIAKAATIDGGTLDDAKRGLRYVANAERREAERKEDTGDKRPDATIAEGSGELPFILTTCAWKKRHPQWAFAMTEKAVSAYPGVLALILDEGCRLNVDPAGLIAVSGVGSKAGTSLVVLDARRATFAGVQEARPPRVHLEGAAVTIVAPGQVFNSVIGTIQD